MGWFSSFCSSVWSGVSDACDKALVTVGRAVVKVQDFCEKKVAPVLKKAGERCGQAFVTLGEKLGGKKEDIINVLPTRNTCGQIDPGDAMKKERELIDMLRGEAITSLSKIESEMLNESVKMYNDMKIQWENEFEDLDLSRELYDVKIARKRLKDVVKNKVKSMISPSERRFKDIMSLPAGSDSRVCATEVFINWIVKSARKTLNETVDAIFKEQIESLFDKVEDYVTMSEKQSQKEVDELKKLVAEEKSGAAAKEAVMAESYAMLQKCDYLSDILESA